jgi:tRNA (mo5U34)-methyltransferase
VTPEELRDAADAIDWYHSIDLGQGVVTEGSSTPETRVFEHELPGFTGRSVLDIGAWDGYYSFLAERNGASRVVALDHYVWGLDWAGRDRYWQECKERGELPDHSKDADEFFNPELPGRRGFDFARDALASKVEPVVADFATTDLESLGTFDVVLYLGVLYHMMEPLTCLQRVRSVTREVAVIETAAVHIPGYGDRGLVEFFAGSDLNLDYGNWYAPTIEGLRRMARAAGFSRVETIKGPPADPPPERRVARAANALSGKTPEPPAGVRYRALVHAYV